MCPGRGRMARYGAADCSGGHEARLLGPASEAAATISTSQQEAAHQAPCPRTANLDPISLITSAANCAHLSPRERGQCPASPEVRQQAHVRVPTVGQCCHAVIR